MVDPLLRRRYNGAMRPGRHLVAVLALAALATPAPVFADDEVPERPWVRPVAGAPRERQFLLPLVEIPLMNIALTLNNWAMFNEPWTWVTMDTIAANLSGGWEFDTDDFDINNVGHPYQGSYPYLATRSAGYTFWQGMLGAGLGSFMWEIAGEAEPPSINDMITTTFGGSFLGEALHRTSIALLRSANGWPYWLRLTGSILLNPVGAFNRWLTDGRYDLADYDDDAPLLGRFSVGLNALGQVTTSEVVDFPAVVLGEEVHFGASLRSGLPGYPGFSPKKPFDHFDVQLEASISRTPFAKLFVSGLMVGDDFTWGTWGRGVWGLFGSYDFSNPPVLRVSTVAAGPGLGFAASLSRSYELQFIGVVSGVAWGASGALPLSDDIVRPYHIGPGGQAWLELQLINRRAGLLRATLRQYLISGAYAEPGLEWITTVSFGGAIAVTDWLEITLDGVVTERHTYYGDSLPDLYQRGTQARVGLSWVTTPGHGATRPRK